MKAFSYIAQEGFNKPAREDRRKRVNYLVVAYEEGSNEYRVKYEFDRNTNYEDMLNSIPRELA